jgi:hypothetical protein
MILFQMVVLLLVLCLWAQLRGSLMFMFMFVFYVFGPGLGFMCVSLNTLFEHSFLGFTATLSARFFGIMGLFDAQR